VPASVNDSRRVERLKSVNRNSASSDETVLLNTDGGTSRVCAADVKDFASTARQKNLMARSLSMFASGPPDLRSMIVRNLAHIKCRK
jgi:hypothetical protein